LKEHVIRSYSNKLQERCLSGAEFEAVFVAWGKALAMIEYWGL
jgi:hypothetical protein